MLVINVMNYVYLLFSEVEFHNRFKECVVTNDGRMLMSQRVALAGCFVILLGMLLFSPRVSAYGLSRQNEEVLKYTVRNPCVCTLIHTIEIENFGISPAKNVRLCVPLVRNETARRFVIIKEFYPETPRVSSDGYGNLYAQWDIGILSKGKTFTVSITYNILTFTITYHVNPELVKPYEKTSAIYQNFTQPENLVESNHPLIISTAENIVGNETNPYKMVSKIYSFVTETLNYKTQPQEQGALWALQHKEGDCSEFSYLFVALCRAAGIPAKINTGFAFQGDVKILDAAHMWAEYYIENYGWIPVDPSWGLLNRLDNNHFGSLSSFPEELEVYTTSHLEYMAGGLRVKKEFMHKSHVSLHVFNEFSFIQKLCNATLEIQQAERLLALARLLGASLIFRSEFEKACETLGCADLCVQKALDSWGNDSGIAERYIEDALSEGARARSAAESLFQKSIFLPMLAFVIVVVVVIVVYVKRRRRVEEYVFEVSYEPVEP